MQSITVRGKVVYVEKVVHINLVFIRPQNVLEPTWDKQPSLAPQLQGLATFPT